MSNARNNSQGIIQAQSINAGPLSGFRNRIINGNCAINQRGATSTIVDSAYMVDRWAASNNISTNMSLGVNSGINPSITSSGNIYAQTSATPKVTLSAGDYVGWIQSIEGYNIADLLYGTAAARPVTISFRAYASQTTTIALSIRNSASDRAYVVAVPITAGYGSYNVTIPGCTNGVWNTNTGVGMRVSFFCATGSTYFAPSLNTWNNGIYIGHPSCSNIADTALRSIIISDVQLEAGIAATPYEMRNYGLELSMCQRYYFKTFASSQTPVQNSGTYSHEVIGSVSGIVNSLTIKFPVVMRVPPTLISYSPNLMASGWANNGGGTPTYALVNVIQSEATVRCGGTGLTAGYAYTISFTGDAEL